MTSTIRVALGDRSYDIRIAAGLLDQAGSLLRPVLTIPRVYVVTDENVEKWHLDQLTSSLDGAGIENHGVVMPAGEHTKGFPHLESLIDGMLEAGCARDTTVIAFGGGVIGDLAGFAAGIFMRGIPFVQIPTTLLAQVDSSVGGKTAINTRQGKNLVGCFYQPRLVLADLNVLDTLPLRELRSGYGEIVKYGLIDDPAFFDWLDDHAADVMNGDVAARQYCGIDQLRGQGSYRRCPMNGKPDKGLCSIWDIPLLMLWRPKLALASVYIMERRYPSVR